MAEPLSRTQKILLGGLCFAGIAIGSTLEFGAEATPEPEDAPVTYGCPDEDMRIFIMTESTDEFQAGDAYCIEFEDMIPAVLLDGE